MVTLFSCCIAWFPFIIILNKAASHLSKPLAQPIHWAYSTTFECMAIVHIFLSCLLHTASKKPVGRLDGRPILLVHGYLNNSAVWKWQKKWLAKAGLGPIYTIDLGHPFQSICLYAQEVKERAEEIARETGRNDLVLIGQSMGGLVCAWYAAKLAPAGKVAALITMAAPLNGTPIAKFAPGTNAREMEPNSPFLQELKEALLQSRSFFLYHLASETDTIVIPGTSAKIEGNDHFVFKDIGHASMFYPKRVADKICERLL